MFATDHGPVGAIEYFELATKFIGRRERNVQLRRVIR
jgi:hypothetical protein